MSNELAVNRVNDLKNLLNETNVSQRLQEVLGKRAAQFASSIVSAVSNNKTLAKCDPMTIVQAAMQAAILDLPIQQNLGFAYLVPYKHQENGVEVSECQFQMGYKGYIQLAIRTGLYEKINITDIREGEFVSWNPLTEELKVEFIVDVNERLTKAIVGYAGFMRMLNGYEKITYWSINEVLEHGKKYSAQYRKTKSGMWVDQEDAMCRKTVIKEMLSKWGALSVEMQRSNEQLLTAIQADQAVIRGEKEYDYVDNKNDDTNNGEVVDAETGEILMNGELPDFLKEPKNISVSEDTEI